MYKEFLRLLLAVSRGNRGIMHLTKYDAKAKITGYEKRIISQRGQIIGDQRGHRTNEEREAGVVPRL